MKKFLYWLPRILGILLILYYVLFALDAFDIEYSTGEMLVAFLMHLIPSFILIVLLLIAWKWELAGGILYIGLCAFYVYMARGMNWMVYIYIGGPLLLTGILFILHYFLYRKKQNSKLVNQA